MLSEMTPEQMNELAAFDSIEPIGEEKVCEVLANGFSVLAQLIVIGAGIDGLDDIQAADFMPWVKREKKTQKPASPNEMAAAVKMFLGRSKK